jgi:hypothetical protein
MLAAGFIPRVYAVWIGVSVMDLVYHTARDYPTVALSQTIVLLKNVLAVGCVPLRLHHVIHLNRVECKYIVPVHVLQVEDKGIRLSVLS